MQYQPVQKQHFYKVYNRKRKTADSRHAPLLPHDAQRVTRLGVAQRQTSYDRRRGLSAGVAAGTHEHRDKGDKPRLNRKLILKLCEYHAGKGRRQHQEHQPGYAVFPHLQRTRAGIGLVGRSHTCHDFKVLGGLFFHDVDDVVNGDDADETPLKVNNGYCHKVIVGYLLGDALLVLRRRCEDDVCVHYLLDDRVVLGKKKALYRDYALKLTVGGGDKAYIYCLLVLAYAAYARYGFAHGHIFLEIHKLRGHYAAGGILGVVEILVYELARLGGCGAHDTLDDVCRKLLHHVNRIVNVQLLKYSGKLGVGDGVYYLLLLGRVKVCKDLRRPLLRQQTKDHRHTVIADAGEKLRHVKFLHILEPLLETLHVAPVKQLRQFIRLPFVDGFKVHGSLLLFVILQWTDLLSCLNAEIIRLLAAETVYFHAHRAELSACDRLIQLTRYRDNAGAKLTAVSCQILRAQRLYSKAHVHYLRRMSICRRKVYETPLGYGKEGLSARKLKALNVVPCVILSYGKLTQPRHIDLNVKVTGVCEYRAVLHEREVLSRDYPAAARDGDEYIAEPGGFMHGHDLVAVHDRLKCADGVRLGDYDLCAEPLCPQAHALAAPAVAGDDDVLAGDDEVCRAHDAVPDALPGAVAVIEHMLAVGLVDHDHREAKLTGAIHGTKTVYAGGGLLTAADNAGDEISIFGVHEVDKVAAVVDDYIRRALKHGAETFVIFVHIAAVAGEDLHTAGGKRGGNVVLRGERIGACDVHLGAAHLHNAAEICGLGLKMHRQRDAKPRKGLSAEKILTYAAQHGHIALYPFDFQFPRGCEGDVIYSAHVLTSCEFILLNFSVYI